MSLTCPCGAPVVADDDAHAQLLADSGATLLCEACDHADVDDRAAVVDVADQALNADRLRRIRSLMEDAGIPARHCTAAISDPPRQRFTPESFQLAAHAAIVTWAADGGVLTLAGSMGTGKSTLAARAGLRTLAYGHRLTWRSTVEVVSGLWANDVQVRDAAERLLYHGTGALVLDDLDTAKTTGAALETLGGLVDRWYAAEQPLLITTNATSPQDLAAKYGRTGERIASRLKAGPWIDVIGPDLRGPAAPS